MKPLTSRRALAYLAALTMKIKWILLALLVLCVPHALLAQEQPELFSRIERVFREKEPAWKVEQILPHDLIYVRSREITFRSARGQAAVAVEIWVAEKDARDVFTATSIAFDDNPLGGRRVKRSLPGLGDENHIWTQRGSTAWPTFKFRKGNINVLVFAPNVAIAKRFAQHIFTQITELNNSNGQTTR